MTSSSLLCVPTTAPVQESETWKSEISCEGGET